MEFIVLAIWKLKMFVLTCINRQTNTQITIKAEINNQKSGRIQF